MAKHDDKQKGKGSGAAKLLVGLIVVFAGFCASGYFFPDLPWSGTVRGFFETAAKGVDKSGVYEVKISNLVVDHQEFKQGEKLDLQVTVKIRDADGDETTVWESEKFGERISKVGSDSLTASWADRPFEVQWEPGTVFVIEVWDFVGRNKLIARLTTDASKKEFPLKGSLTLRVVKGDKEVNERRGGTNQITFESKFLRDLPVEN